MKILILLAIASVAVCGQVDVFSAQEGGYFCVKIPVLVVLKSNTLLAFGEARMDSCSDFAHTDLVMKSSHDNGKTWSDMRVIVTNSSATENNVIGNAAPVQDRVSGRIIMPYCRNNHEVYIIFSDDDGEHWTSPVPVANATQPSWKWIGLGPPAGLQLETGRIVVPAYHETLAHEDGTFTKGHTMISDDLGLSWRLGKDFGGMHFPNEAQAVDLGNNRVLINARGIGTRRLEALSTDGGETISSLKVIGSLPESIDGCEGSMIRVPPSPIDDKEWFSTGPGRNSFQTPLLLFSNPHEGGLYRYNMSVMVSEDEGQKWTACRLITSGPSGYSAMGVMADGSVGLLYERSAKKEIIFTPDQISFEIVWLPGCKASCGC